MRAVIFANGYVSDPAGDAAHLRPDDWLIAADGGARHAREMGVVPHVLVGDCDSIAPEDLDALVAAGCAVVRHPPRKDFTDLELALRYALARVPGVDEIVVLGGLGGRWDHTLANVLLLALPDLRTRPVQLLDGAQSLRLAPATLQGAPGDTVSLIPLRGDAHGVTTTGLEYPLTDGTLPFGASLGVSNVLTAPTATISVRDGVVLVVHTRGGV